MHHSFMLNYDYTPILRLGHCDATHASMSSTCSVLSVCPLFMIEDVVLRKAADLHDAAGCEIFSKIDST